MDNPRLAVGVDIGGTFTDVVAFDLDSGAMHVAKVPSTPDDLVQGFVAGLADACARFEASPSAVAALAHGTTIATNAILERRGARLGILATEGFRDVIVLGRMKRSEMYDLFMEAETPLFLAPRHCIAGIPERMDADGKVVRPLDEAAALDAVRRLVEDEAIDALVVCFLHSYANPAHERRVGELVAERYPDLPVSLSVNVDPRFREYERLVVTAFDAYVRPAITRYVGRLGEALAKTGVQAPLQLMQSHGGLSGASAAVDRPVSTVLSGPAAGVIGAARAASGAGLPDAISIDVGGTSADVALIPGGRPLVTTEGRVDRYPLRLPSVDVRTVGAGGGSIAYIDAGGALKVGPQSAGASPGPACYGRGGMQPAVTDASVVLGYLAPDSFAGGIALDPALAEAAIAEHVARPLGIDVPAAALGIHRVINSRMAQALRLVSVERGYDPRGFTLVALGGAGPVHAGRLAEELSIPRVLVPARPGVLSALGLLLAGIEHEAARTRRMAADAIDAGAVGALFAELDASCGDRMRQDGVAPGEATVERFAEMRYRGQSYELEVPLEGRDTGTALTAAAAGFHDVHHRQYGYANPGAPVEFVSFRSVHRGPPLVPAAGSAAAVGSGGTPAPRVVRTAWFQGQDAPVETPVYQRATLPAGFTLEGPAIVEQEDTTTVVYPGHRLAVDPQGNLVIEVRAG